MAETIWAAQGRPGDDVRHLRQLLHEHRRAARGEAQSALVALAAFVLAYDTGFDRVFDDAETYQTEKAARDADNTAEDFEGYLRRVYRMETAEVLSAIAAWWDLTPERRKPYRDARRFDSDADACDCGKWPCAARDAAPADPADEYSISVRQALAFVRKWAPGDLACGTQRAQAKAEAALVLADAIDGRSQAAPHPGATHGGE